MTLSTLLSAIQPSGVVHLGNYLGAIKQWVELQNKYQSYFCIVDQHAITVPYDQDRLSQHTLDAATLYIACGIDPQKSVIFVQSHVPAHTELAWLLSTITSFGELSRMTQFKDKSRGKNTAASVGLFSYPVLMAADILLYQASTVPVGEDQTQHLELTRTLAKRFNARFGQTFTVPKAFIPTSTARIMSLTDPHQKMSKSDPNSKSYLALTDDLETTQAKIKAAVTETEAVFSFGKSGPAVQNLLKIYQALSQKPSEEIEQEFQGQNYSFFKHQLSEVVISALSPIREKYLALRHNEEKLQSILKSGADKARAMADQTLAAAKKAMGLLTYD